MLDSGLINYTRDAKVEGKSDAEIITILQQNGQSEEQIHLIF